MGTTSAMPSVCSGQTIFMGVPLSMPAMMAVMEAMQQVLRPALAKLLSESGK